MKDNDIKKIISYLKNNEKIVSTLVIVVIFTDIFFIKNSSDFIIFGNLLLSVIFIKIFQIKSKATFLLCIALLTAMFINYLFTGASISTEKAAVWLVLFLGVGIIQQWKE